MSVKHMWYKDKVFETKNKAHIANGESLEYDVDDPDFKTLH